MFGNSLMTLANLSQTLCLVSFHATSFISSRKSEKLKHDSDTFASSMLSFHSEAIAEILGHFSLLCGV